MAPNAWRWCSAPRPPASARPKRPTRGLGRRRRRFPADLARPIVHTPHSLGDFVQHATGLRGPCVTVATACSSSAKVFAQAARLIAGRPGRCRAGRRRRYACAAACCSASTRCSWCRPNRAGRSMPDATACRWARPAVSPCSNARSRRRQPACNCAAMANPATPTTCPRRIRRAWARSWRCAMRWRAPASTPARSVTSTCTAPPRRPTIRSRRARSPALFPDSLHASSTKGWTGHTLGAAGIVESVIALIALEHGELPGTLNSATPDPACGPQIRFDNAQRATSRYRDEQFLRLRRQQLLAGVRSRMTSRCSRRIEGIGFWTRGLPSWAAARAFAADGTLPDDAADASPSPQLLRAQRTPPRAGNGRGRARSRAGRLHRGRPRSGDAAVGVRLHPRRPGDHRLHVRDPGRRSARDLADALPQLRAQRRRRLLDHRHRRDGAGHRDQRATTPASPRACSKRWRSSPPAAEAVLLVAYDGRRVGPLAQMSPSDGLLGGALVLVATGRHRRRALSARLVAAATPRRARARWRGWPAGNAMAPMLPLFDALALVARSARLKAGPGHDPAGGDRA